MVGSPFHVDWTDFADVCKYCDKLNAIAKETHKSVVIKIPGRNNYNITFRTNAVRAQQTILYPK